MTTPRWYRAALAVCLAVLLTAIGSPLRANHTAGADISYRCLGGTQYEVTLKVYRDCSGAATPGGCDYNCVTQSWLQCNSAGAPFLVMRSSCGGCQVQVLSNPTVTEVTPICPTVKTTCSGGNQQGIEEFVYKVTVNLAACNFWTLTYANYARNANITNIQNPSTTGMQVSATLNNANGCNNSPTFANKPVPWTCQGAKWCFNHGAVDPDGDVLTYKLVTPKNENGGNIVYKTGFSATQPLTSNPAVTIDPNTGDICMTPTNAEVTVMAVEVTEWRNGVKVGTTIRDIQITVIACNNKLPQVTGINSTGKFSDTICVGLGAYCIDIVAQDSNATDKMTMSWNAGIPSPATFTISGNGTTSVSGQFCWTPTAADISSTPYQFVVNIKDDHCPYNGVQSFAFKLTVMDCPIEAKITPDTAICIGECVPLEITSAINGQSAYTYSWSPGGYTTAGPHNVCPTQTTTYTVIVGDQTGTTPDTVKTTVTVNSLPVADAGPDVSICPGDSAQLTATGGHLYSWSPPGSLSQPDSATTKASPPVTTTYTVTVTDTVTGCKDTNTADVILRPRPAASAGPDVTICPGTFTQLQASGGTSYVWTPNLYLSNPNIANPIANPPVPTSYTVTVTDQFGCDSTDDVFVDLFPGPNLTTSNDTAICRGDTISLSVNGGATWNWLPNGSLTSPNSSTTDAFPQFSTTYTIYATDANGCKDTGNIEVQVLTVPTTVAGPDDTKCEGDSAQLSAVGAPFYHWTPAAGLNNDSIRDPLAAPFATTTYTVKGYNSIGCFSTDTLRLTIIPAPSISAGNDVSICQGDSVVLQGSGAPNYRWSPGGTLSDSTIANPWAKPMQTTSYIATTTSGQTGCDGHDTVVVTIFPLINANAGADTGICLGDTGQLFAKPSGMASYNWVPAAGLSNAAIRNPEVFTLVDRDYIVEITDQYGCFDSDTVHVQVHALPTANAGMDDGVCEGFDVTLNGSGGVSYAWSPPNTLSNANIAKPKADPTVTTTYTLVVTDANGCKDSDTVRIFVNPAPPANAGPDRDICPGDTAQLTGSGGNIYNWSPNQYISNTNAQNPEVWPPATMDYILLVFDAIGCSARDTVTVVVHPAAVADAGKDTGRCVTDTIGLNASGGLLYTWLPQGGLSAANIPNPKAYPVVPTNYAVRVTDGNGCVDFDTVFVDVWQLPAASAGPDITVCQGNPVVLDGSGSGPNIVDYLWNPAADLNNATLMSPTATPPSTTDYDVTVTDINGCVARDTMTLTVNPIPVPNAGPDVAICPGTTTELTGSGGGNYEWRPAGLLTNAFISNPTAFPAATQIYTLIVTDAIGCSDSDFVMITVHPDPIANAGPDISYCLGQSDVLQGSGGVNGGYRWSPATDLSDTGVAQPTVSVQFDQTYQLIITDINGCSDTDYVDVTVWPLPVTTATADVNPICPGGTAVLTATGGTGYSWSGTVASPNSAVTDASPAQSTKYYVTVTDANGCEALDSITVDVHPITAVDPQGDAIICPGESAIISATNNAVSYSWNPPTGLSSASVQSPVATPSSTTTYTVTITDANGCQFSDQVTVTLASLPTASAGPDRVIFRGDQIFLDGSGGLTYQWIPATDIDDPTAENPVVSPLVTTTYTVIVTDANGCVASDEVLVEVFERALVFIPSAFTPNGDGINDVLSITSIRDFDLEYFAIYDRWGRKLFSTTDRKGTWDGTYKGVPQPIESYVYIIRGTDILGNRVNLNGNVTIIR